MKLYLCIIILGGLFAITGIRALIKPAPFHHINGNGSPYYESKNAILNETIWNLAQKWYGIHLTVMGVVYMLSSCLLHPLYIYILTNVWKREDHTIPFFCVILIPFMILLGIAYGTVELRIRKQLKKEQ
ncbi:MAG: hypothetical protein ACI4F4_08985 [Lachnospiraceae bacterium]